jgi:hypothetical protein
MCPVLVPSVDVLETALVDDSQLVEQVVEFSESLSNLLIVVFA